MNDLKFLIESHSYLPFTRRGQIVLSSGDRRVKKGMWVELEKTGEICYVDSVSNSVRFGNSFVDRSTVLNVSRCMIKDYIEGVYYEDGFTGGGTLESGAFVTVYRKKYSYFNIVDSNLIYQTLLQKVENPILSNQEVTKQKEQIATNFGVNKKVFDFFLKRKQFGNL